ncbi:P1 family peptidase [Radiobacillus sp. PE A8.2]|uniref:P1 family peptidase n=1 Tax=Radiobacillus sp. PE A8.2 TaxID=3380349 RepID=UPI00388CFCF2
MSTGQITDVPGILVGQQQNTEALTGCSVIITEAGAIAGVDVRGSAPGTRETDLLNPINLVEKVHGICLTGGSAFGLDAASGVMKYLEEKQIGMDVGVARVPIVPAAVLFDLAIGDPHTRPDLEMGYQAASIASSNPITTGNYGAGCGATVGKLAGFEYCMKAGIGTASIKISDEITIGALVAVNAVGEIRNPATGQTIAGPYDRNNEQLLDSDSLLKQTAHKVLFPGTNTTIGVVAINTSLSKVEATKVSQMAHDAFARTIYPAHTMYDGDTIFTLATGGPKLPVDLIGAMAAKVMEQAILNAVYSAESIGNIPAYNQI